MLYGLVGCIDIRYSLVGCIEILYVLVDRIENLYGLVRKQVITALGHENKECLRSHDIDGRGEAEAVKHAI